jgi:hypothetical protein
MACCANITTFKTEVMLAQHTFYTGKTVDLYGFFRTVVCANITTLHANQD